MVRISERMSERSNEQRPAVEGVGIDRRDFLQRLAAGGLLFAITATGCHRVADQQSGGQAGVGTSGSTAGEPPTVFSPAAYLRIDSTGAVTVIAHRSEMGQGIRSTFAMLAADELEADWAHVRVEQAPGDEKTYGPQSTDGSHSIRDFFLPMRQAGATARVLLETAAAQRWGVPVGEVKASRHKVAHVASGRTLGFGELVSAAKALPVPAAESVRLKEPSEFRYIGKDMPSLDLFDMTTGRARYGIDQQMPGMLVAVIARPPVYGGRVATVDSRAAEAVPGVVRIVRLDHSKPPSGMSPKGGVAVIARNTWAAIKGRNALSITWHDGPNADYDSESYRAMLERAVHRPGRVVRKQGNTAVALAEAATRVSRDYYMPHFAHAPMEPPSALAMVANGRCEVWAPTQDPQNARDELVKALHLPEDRVQVNVTLLGGAFGRKSFPDFIIEAALLSRVVGSPIKVVWTREDDLQHDFYHSVAAEHLEAGLDGHGRVSAWLHRAALPPEDAQHDAKVIYQDDSEVGQGMTDLPFAIPNIQAESGAAVPRTRIGWYRSVINLPHAFAICSFVDELAHAAKRDPKEFILELLGPDRLVDMQHAGVVGKPWNYDKTFDEFPIETARLRGVLELVTDRAGWGQPLSAGQGRGLAVHRSYLSYAAAVIVAAVQPDGTVSIPRVDLALDAGFIANPDRVNAQLQGATVMGLSNALYGGVKFANGRAVQSNFDTYQLARLDVVPRQFHVYIVPSAGKPAGVGEPGVPPIAPALCNAIFAATGVRIRQLPIGKQAARPTVV